jgi:long-subunit fatty acid transport protein
MIGLLMKRQRYVFIILLWILLFLPYDGAAGINEQLAIDTRAMSLANSVTADPEGPFSVHYNPAGLDRTTGSQAIQGLNWVPILEIKGKYTQGRDPATGKLWAPFGGWFNNGIDPEGGRGSNTSPMIQLPFLGKLPFIAAPFNGIVVHEKDSPFAYGFAIVAPYAGGWRHTEDDDPYRFLGKSVSLMRVVLEPGVSYRVTKNLAIGASFGMGLSFMGFETRMRSPNDMVALTGALGQATAGLEIPIISELTLPPPWFGGGLSPYEDVGGLKFFAQDLFNPSYNIGFLWDPYSWLSFGGVYQSQANADMKGRYTWEYKPSMQRMVNWLGSTPLTVITASILGLPTHCPDQMEGNMSINVIFPARAQFGIKLQPHPRIKLLVDANWTDWEAWKTQEIVFDRDMPLLQLARLMGYRGGIRTMIVQNGFKNEVHLTYGLELKPLDHVTLRLGYEDRPTSNTANYFGMLPLWDLKILSFGIGIDESKKAPHRKIRGLKDLIAQSEAPDQVDIGVSYITSEHKVSFNQSKNFNSVNFTDMIYNPFAGLEYDMKATMWVISLKETYYW